MSLALHELLICCRRLENEKAGERRKEVENFKRLLCDSETVNQLDRNSDSKQGKQLNWDAVFSVLQKYFQKEMKNLQLTKPNASASTQTARQKKIHEVGSLVKYFIILFSVLQKHSCILTNYRYFSKALKAKKQTT
ncbi:serine-protein kinase ATM-like [Heliangelus exortis]|uniref:serine-protein kinase ATM-like n=1 Tax=Heliangelus exortis TaxID=472823 RepID=UPI003A92D6B0